MHRAIGIGRILASGVCGGDEGGDQRSQRDQTEPLVNLEHVRSFVEPGLILGASLSLLRRNTQIL
jgi:hypothetical protein